MINVLVRDRDTVIIVMESSQKWGWIGALTFCKEGLLAYYPLVVPYHLRAGANLIWVSTFVLILLGILKPRSWCLVGTFYVLDWDLIENVCLRWVYHKLLLTIKKLMALCVFHNPRFEQTWLTCGCLLCFSTTSVWIRNFLLQDFQLVELLPVLYLKFSLACGLISFEFEFGYILFCDIQICLLWLCKRVLAKTRSLKRKLLLMHKLVDRQRPKEQSHLCSIIYSGLPLSPTVIKFHFRQYHYYVVI